VLDLKETMDYLVLFAIAASLGAIGGLGAELLQSRRGQTGLIELPHGSGSSHYRDWGVWADVVLGAIAAVAALWVFPPEVHTTVEEGGGVTSVSQYDLIKVVGLSLIIGSAGSSVLTALQARALARVKEQEAEVTRNVATNQLEAIKQEIQAAGAPTSLTTSVETAQAAIEATRPGFGSPAL
jgi:hypothetical protein